MTKCELCLRLLLGRSPLRIALSWEANYAASMMQKCLLTVSCCVLVPFYLSATCLYGSCALKRIVFANQSDVRNLVDLGSCGRVGG
jgi:hypothetical protein